ncbi:LysR family transcriptional regulator [Propionivibrio dicarboxylicus]|uniref:DNA-binding transcriptional regulator, LysR family n=1 Tax=Propionivibrio dicarboxylicus TaxID=83767 RepID=A0A1G8KBC6_9RHOO|nr:LysR family transcriptional regulator [Propionivibrio dicarboxylicus]SDI40738.1 DNA-binding transcriptional regulator, LysR family [Propionivibrio dicarboxylicus]
MDVRRLKYFIVTAEERSISRAAERLHITQPPLTRHIQSLEEELGVLLFTRTSWGVELTQAGAALLKHAHNISAHIELATEQIRRVATGQAGRIDIGVFGSAMLSIIPKLLRSFSATHPDVKVVLHNTPKERQIGALHQGRILVAFDRYLPEFPNITSELVYREPLYVALNQSNPLAQQTEIKLDDLRNEPLIDEQDQSVFIACRTLFKRHSFEPIVAQKAGDLIAATIMVSGGFGTALVPESILNLQLPNVVFRPLATDVECLIDLHCAYRKDEDSRLLNDMLDCVRAYQRDQLPPAAGTPTAA